MLTKLRFLFGSCLILLTSTFVLSQTQKLSSAEALQRYRKSLSYLQSVSMKMVANVDSDEHELFPQTLDFVFRQDGQNNRAEWIGKQLIYDSDGEIDLQNSSFIKDISDGSMYVGLEGDHLKNTIDTRRILLQYNYEERLKQLLENTNYGGPLFGKMFGSNHKSVADLLCQSSDLHIHDKKENFNGVACLVLEGTSEYGKVTAWIAPERGYSAMKWVIEKDPHHLFDDAVISTKWPNIEKWKITFDVKELHEIIDEDNTEFVPKLAHTNFTINFHDGTKNVDHFEWKTSDIQINPDFEVLGAFKIDFPDGIRVFNKDFPSVDYKWENGKPVTDAAATDKKGEGVRDESQRIADALQRYRQSLSYSQSVSVKILTDVDSFEVDINNERHPSDEEIFPQKIDVVFRRDRQNNRVEWLGKHFVYGLQNNVDLASSRVVKTIADGNIFVDLQAENLLDEYYPSRIMLLHYYKERQGSLLGNPNQGGPLFGKMYGNNYISIADSLGQSSDLYIYDKKENINGVACFILEGTSQYGKVTAWIAPEKGYSAMKWVIEKSSHSLFDNVPLSTKWPSVKSGKDIFTLKELHEVKVDGKTVFVPKRAHCTYITNFRDGTKSIDEYEYQTSDIQINPDFEALGAFKIDFPDGTRVFDEEAPNLIYIWKNGKPVVRVEASDKKDNVSQKEAPAGADTKVDTLKTKQELLSEPGPLLTVLLIPIGLVIIGIIGWSAFRRLRY